MMIPCEAIEGGELGRLNTVEDRMAVLAALSGVDYVVPFTEDTPAAVDRASCSRCSCKGRRLFGRSDCGA